MKNGLIAVAIILAGCSRHPGTVAAEQPDTLVARRQIWAAIQPLAAERHLDPNFVYAIVAAESHFNPRAHRGEAKGLMQIKPRAWRSVSTKPFEADVWNWRANLEVGIDLLASLKASLEARHAFSYPALWASYHYGFEYTASKAFDMSRIPRPSDAISFRLWKGDPHPVPPPR